MKELNIEKPSMKNVLSEEEARDLADRMRAKIGIDPDATNKITPKEGEPYNGQRGELRYHPDRIEREVTKKDYEKALEAIEELEKLADEETTGEEIGYKITRAIQKGGQVLVGIPALLGVGLTGSPDQVSKILDSFKANRGEWIDAKKKLIDLIKAGDKIRDKETENFNKN